jgi:hypothetical protein
MIPLNNRIANLAALATVDAPAGTEVWVDSESCKYASVPAYQAASDAIAGPSDLEPTSWQPATRIIQQNGTSKGVSTIGGTPLATTPIVSGSGTNVLWSLAVPAATMVRVTIEAEFSAAGNKSWSGALECRAKRIGTGALTILSTGAGFPWQLSDASWDPRFAANSNTLEFRVTADATANIVPRGTVSIVTTDTSADPVVAIDAQIDAIFPTGIIDDWDPANRTMSGSNVETIIGRFGHTLTNSTAAKFQMTTIGSRPAIVGTGNVLRSLNNAALGANIVTVITVAVIPTLPFADYDTIVTSANGIYVFCVGATGASNLFNAGQDVHWVGGVHTENVTAGTRVIVTRHAADTAQTIAIGGHPSLTARAYTSPIGRVIALSTTVTDQQIIDVSAALAAWYA